MEGKLFYNSLVRPCTQEEGKAEGSPDSVEHCQLAQELEADDEQGNVQDEGADPGIDPREVPDNQGKA